MVIGRLSKSGSRDAEEPTASQAFRGGSEPFGPGNSAVFEQESNLLDDPAAQRGHLFGKRATARGALANGGLRIRAVSLDEAEERLDRRSQALLGCRLGISGSARPQAKLAPGPVDVFAVETLLRGELRVKHGL